MQQASGHRSKGPMERIATFIVDKRKGFFVLFILLFLYSLTSIAKVNVNNELTDYLSQDTQTRQGLDIMDREMKTFGSAKILVANITYDNAFALAKELDDVRGISSVRFYDAGDDLYEDNELTDYYQDASALFTLAFDEEEDTELSQKAIAEVREKLAGYDAYVYTTVDKDDAANLREDIKVIMVIAVVIIIGVLVFTSQTYMEIVVFLLTFLMAGIINMGTNYWFGEVSFITNAVGPVLQLAMAIDYAIILFHRFMEEKERYQTRKAMIKALSKAIPEVSSSSLTTISGMVALMFMQFGIGPDLGRVLTKAILISLVTVFGFMPALMMMFDRWIEKTRHKSFVPKINRWGKLVVKTRYILLPIFAVTLCVCVVFSGKCPYIFDLNSIETRNKNEYIAAKERIDRTFETTNTMALLVPTGNYQAEAMIISSIENLDMVDTVVGLASIEVGDNKEYTLVDSLRPRELAEVADIDVDLAKMAYRLYAVDKEQYGALVGNLDDFRVPIINMVDFIYDLKENKGFSLDAETSQDIDDLYKDLCEAREQMEGGDYSRIIFLLKGPVESDETFRQVDAIRDLAQSYYEDEIFVVGDSTSARELSDAFRTDNTLISALTALFVGVILLFTFQSAGLPILLVLTIQGSIWINFSVPYLTGSSMFFLSYLVVSSIQMGATIDYAIVITSRYMDLRGRMDKKTAVIESLNQAFPTVLTSGTILCSAAFIVGLVTSNGAISSLGLALSRGTLISMILVMTVLPQILLVGDRIIDKTAFTISKAADEAEQKLLTSGTAVVDGHVKGYFCGVIDAQVAGTLQGEMQISLQNRLDQEAKRHG